MRSLTFFLFLLPAISFAQKDKAVIKAAIPGLEAGQTVYWRVWNEEHTDSVSTAPGGFSFEIPLSGGDIYLVQIGKKNAPHTSVYLYLDRGTTTIRGNGPYFKNAVVAGNPAAKDFAEYRAFIDSLPAVKAMPQLYEKITELYEKKDTAGLRSVGREFKKIDSIKLANGKAWVESHSSSPVAGVVFASYIAEGLGAEASEEILNDLTAAAKNNRPVKRLLASIEAEKATAIGRLAREFTLADTAGRQVSLKNFRGKYVLLDFWASWCKPCRAENPNVVKAFKKYSDKNFTVLGVSLDQKGQKDRWLKAIHDDQLTWTHVSDLNSWGNAAAKLYNIREIPANFLIDPQGVIIAKNLRGEELENKLAELIAARQSFTIEGALSNSKAGKIYLFYPSVKSFEKDSSVIVNGSFHFSGTITAPAEAYCALNPNMNELDQRRIARFFLEEKDMKLAIDNDKFDEAVLSGSKTEEEYRVLKDKLQEVDRESGQSIENRKSTVTQAFFMQYPNSYVTLRKLLFEIGKIPADSLEKITGAFTPQTISTTYGQKIIEKVKQIRAASPGSSAPPFSAKDIDNAELKLADFKGGYVLLDFWASWCVPCRKSNPHLKELYHKYHDKGIEFIGISDDDSNPAAWKKAVEKDSLPWRHVLRGHDGDKVNKGIKNDLDICDKYAIQFLPTKILIDPSGKIVGRYDDSEEAFDRRLKEIFGF